MELVMATNAVEKAREADLLRRVNEAVDESSAELRSGISARNILREWKRGRKSDDSEGSKEPNEATPQD